MFRQKDTIYIRYYEKVAYIATRWIPELINNSQSEYMCVVYTDK